VTSPPNGWRLSGFAGYAMLRAVFLADLATVELRGEDREQACFFADEATGQVVQAGYAASASRLREFRARRRRREDFHPVRPPDEQLAALG
jgi:hypothetical protein